jgi:hypothetical protein
VGDLLSRYASGEKKKKERDLASVTPVGGDAPPPPPASPRLADSLTFIGLFGFTGVFVTVAMVALTILAMYLAFKAENGATIPASQVLVLYGIAALSIMNTFKLVVYWRSMVTGIVEIIKGEVDPLSALDMVPTLMKLLPVRAPPRRRRPPTSSSPPPTPFHHAVVQRQPRDSHCRQVLNPRDHRCRGV